MRRLASHFIWFKKVYHLHYLELDETGRLMGIYPLTEEIAHTEFYNGVLIPLPPSIIPRVETITKEWEALTDKMSIGSVVQVYQMDTGNLITL